MEHEIYIEAEVASSPELEGRLKQAVLAALEAEGVDVPCIIEVCLTDDEGIHQTNLDMRGVDAPTDVLSFPMFDLKPGEKPQADWADPDTDKVLLGDMMISLERAGPGAGLPGVAARGGRVPGQVGVAAGSCWVSLGGYVVGVDVLAGPH